MRKWLLLAAVLGSIRAGPSGGAGLGRPAEAHAPASPGPSHAQVGTPDSTALLQRLESIVRLADTESYLTLLARSADRERALAFADAELRRGASRVVIQERDRVRTAGEGAASPRFRSVVDVFVEEGAKARVATWQLDAALEDGEWRLTNQARLSGVESLYRLSVNRTKQFDARNFVVSAEDLDLTLIEGSVFTIDTDEATIGLVLLGRGEMNFHPSPETEKGQVKIFAGDTSCVARFDAAYVRFGALSLHADPTQLLARPVDESLLRRAERVFREESAKSFGLDLGDLSRDSWSLVPAAGDFLSEVRTKRYDTLTYARTAAEAEDIAFFDRRRQRNIAMYASVGKLQTRGRFYNEDELAAYDVHHYDIDVSIDPDRRWLEGETTMRLRVRSNPTSQLTIRLADPLVVRSVVSDRFGRMFGLRVKGQNALLVSLPALVMPDTDVTLTIAYAGRLPPQDPDREALLQQEDPGLGTRARAALPGLDGPQGEPHFLYSSRSYWYPQAPISDYATALMHITVPFPYACLASGKAMDESPRLVSAVGSQPGRLYRFRAGRPLRYLSVLVSRFERTASTFVDFDDPGSSAAGAANRAPALGDQRLAVHVDANPRQKGRGRELLSRTVDIARFYEGLTGDIPYESFTLALVEHTTPGGHSPGYFAALYHTLPGTQVTWQNDPSAFDGYPEFFLAHELAHQWWGQALGWRNYHEQWLSEGFAQYFAALYARHRRGDDTFADVLRHMRKWSLEASEQGPIYLGYRLGHIKNEGRVFRALVYNKGATVLHMLRRLVGDEAFFRAVRRFYSEWRYRKAGTDDFRLAVEAESGRPLERFFEQWIYGSGIPRLTFSYAVDSSAGQPFLALRLEQTGEGVFDFPVTLTLDYVDRPPDHIVVPVTERVVEARLALAGALREVSATRHDGTLVRVARSP